MELRVNNDRIKEIRIKSEEYNKQSVFAKQIANCSTAYLSYIENGKKEPNAEILGRILAYRQKELGEKTLNLNYYLSFEHNQNIIADDTIQLLRDSETLEEFLLINYGLEPKSLTILKEITDKIRNDNKVSEKGIVSKMKLKAFNQFIQSPAFSSLIDFCLGQNPNNPTKDPEVQKLKNAYRSAKNHY